MGLYLCVFDGDDEVEGVEVGMYSDFDFFRKSVVELLESGAAGSRFPTLILHHDSDGEWSVEELAALSTELIVVASEFEKLPAIEFPASWQRQVGDSLGLKPQTMCDSFIDVDGEPMLHRLQELCQVAIARSRPIVFQ